MDNMQPAANVTVSVIVGSTRPTRFAGAPAEWVAGHLERRPEVTARLLDLRDYRLPWFEESMSPAMLGEASFEEINFEPAGISGTNYGWRTLEGPECFGAEPTTTCDTTGFTPAAHLYERDFGCAVTGGYVYRGSRIPGLRGTYIFADYCFGNFGSFRMEAGRAVDVRDITDDINPNPKLQLITSFGVDNGGEMYVTTQLGGLFRIDAD